MEKYNLHPNWRALATVHIPYTAFVSEGKTPPEAVNYVQHKMCNISPEEAQKFYENTINTPPAKRKKRQEPQVQDVNESVGKINFDKNKFFRAAMSNDVQTLKMFFYQSGDIDSTDEFDWTALMMSACEGSEDSFSYLLRMGADLSKADKKGNTALTLARMKGFTRILNIGSRKEESSTIKKEHRIEKKTKPFYCKICKTEFKETSMKDHATSTVHRFNSKSSKAKLNRFNMSERNRGLKLMLKQGWDRNSGLGPSSNGTLYPVKTVIRKDRNGLGIKQSEPKVTHFKAFDLAAIKYKPHPRDKTRRELRRDQRRDKWKEQCYRRELS